MGSTDAAAASFTGGEVAGGGGAGACWALGVGRDVVKDSYSSFRLVLVLGVFFGGVGAIIRAGHSRMNSGTPAGCLGRSADCGGSEALIAVCSATWLMLSTKACCVRFSHASNTFLVKSKERGTDP